MRGWEDERRAAELRRHLRRLRLSRRVLFDLLVEARRENEALARALARGRAAGIGRARLAWRLRTGCDPLPAGRGREAARQDSPDSPRNA
ncbi:MAG: hypothetical protein IRZ11_03535 [Clostridia bacterium]|nr:hypothetical protein [Clostridia bacterium]